MIHIEIHTLDDFKAHLDKGAPLSGVVLQELDIAPVQEALKSRDVSGMILLGCSLPIALAADFVNRGVVIFPKITGLPYSPYRKSLYTAEGLFDGFGASRPESYKDTPDAKIYTHYMANGRSSPPDIIEALAQRLHDFSITDALSQALSTREADRCIAIMGGHNLRRDDPDYYAVAAMARALTRRHYTVLSGGGPGAMEATHLGAGLSELADDSLRAAVDIISDAPHYKDRFWLSRAFDVLSKFKFSDSGIAIPTWLYGHEPPTPFASHIAKYFSNSTREDGLITQAAAGIIFAPGNAGTIQEIFQDLAQNHYVTSGQRSPMVFLNTKYWTSVRPVYPVVQAYAKDEPYAPLITCVDRWQDAVAFIEAHPPVEALL